MGTLLFNIVFGIHVGPESCGNGCCSVFHVELKRSTPPDDRSTVHFPRRAVRPPGPSRGQGTSWIFAGPWSPPWGESKPGAAANPTRRRTSKQSSKQLEAPGQRHGQSASIHPTSPHVPPRARTSAAWWCSASCRVQELDFHGRKSLLVTHLVNAQTPAEKTREDLKFIRDSVARRGNIRGQCGGFVELM